MRYCLKNNYVFQDKNIQCREWHSFTVLANLLTSSSLGGSSFMLWRLITKSHSHAAVRLGRIREFTGQGQHNAGPRHPWPQPWRAQQAQNTPANHPQGAIMEVSFFLTFHSVLHHPSFPLCLNKYYFYNNFCVPVKLSFFPKLDNITLDSCVAVRMSFTENTILSSLTSVWRKIHPEGRIST